MKIFFKHIFRSIKKSPLQPIIILLTLIISVATFITSTKLAINVYKENIHNKKLDNYVCDITVKLSKSDDVRMLFPDDVQDIIGKDGKIHGEFDLTSLITMNEQSDLVNIAAVDFEEIDDFYDFRFSDYGKITEENLNNSIIISTNTAKAYNVGIGDTFTFNLLNRKFEMTVEAIALPDGLFSGTAALINIGAVSEALADANPAIASLADTLVPFTAIRIQINDKDRIDEFIDKLSSDERLSGKLIVKESENVGSADFMNLLAMTVISVSAAIIIVISIVVISTALELLSRKRMKDSALFMISGADVSQLNRILYFECLIYSIFAAIFGTLLSIPICEGMNNIFAWNTEDITFRLYDILIATVASPLTVLITAVIHTTRTKMLTVSERMSEEAENRGGMLQKKVSLILLLTALILFIAEIILPVKARYIIGFPALLFFIFFTYTLTPHLVTLISCIFIKITERQKKIPAIAITAFKNTYVSYPLKHTARLITVLVTLICTAFTCLGTINKQADFVNSVVDCEYVSIGANEKTDEILGALDEVEDTFRITFSKNLISEAGTGILGISIAEDALDMVNKEIAPKKAPKNDEIVVSSGISILSGKGVGDSITFSHETNDYTFKIIEIIPSNANIAFLDAEYIGEENELLCIKSSVNKKSEDYQKICNILEVRGAALVDFSTVITPITERIISHSELLFFVIIVALFTTLIGIANVLFSAYVTRKHERAVYYTAGMTKTQIKMTALAEIITVLFISMMLIPIFSFISVMMLDVSINSFGVDMIYF